MPSEGTSAIKSDRWSAAARGICHPVFAAALAVLVLNDGWWKGASPGLVTGKLSDVAGVVVAAALLSAAGVAMGAGERRATIASATTVGLLFAVMKTSVWGATAAESMWTALDGRRSGVVVDPTDLVALLALPIVPSLWTTGLWSTRRQRAGSRRRTARSLVAIVLGSAAIVATTATAACGIGPQVESVRLEGDRLVAADGSGDTIGWSTDGGATWSDAPYGPAGPNAPPSGRETYDPAQPGDACFGDDCWRAVDGRLVHLDGDHTSTILEAGGDQRTGCDQGSASVRSVVAVTTGSGAHVVIAAMGGQGVAVARFDGRDLGDFDRMAIGGTSIPSGFGESWPPRAFWLAGSIVSLTAAGAIGSAFGRSRHGRVQPGSACLIEILAVAVAGASLLGGIVLSMGLAEPTGFRAATGLAMALVFGLFASVSRAADRSTTSDEVPDPG